MKKKNIYIDYKIKNTSNYLGNSFPPLIYKYLLNVDSFNVFSLADRDLPSLDCIIIINGGSHWTYKDLNFKNIHKNQILKWIYPKFKKLLLVIGYLLSLRKIGFFSHHMYSNKSYEKHLNNLIQRNPKAKIIHRLDGIYQLIGKVYGYDATIEKINKMSNLTVYQSKYSKKSWEKGTKTVFGKSTTLSPKHSVIINNGVDSSIFNTDGEKYNFKVKFPILNVSASPSPKKGLYRILELAECLKENPDFHFFLIGKQKFDPICGSEIQYFNNVSYLGEISDRIELSKYYKGAKIFMFPSEEDCSPNVILEAMACGLPILTVESGGIPELINRNNKKAGVYIDDSNPIMGLNNLLKFYETLSNNSLKLIKNNFNFDLTGQNYQDEINKLIY
tara:strand:- start:325 stop:1491 length:1167 start_codon:yes stop_codon:yes gene_type:complete